MSKTIAIIGAKDFVDRAFTRYFRDQGEYTVLSFDELDLDPTQFHDVIPFFRKNKVDYVVLNSVRSGGIQYNQDHPAELFYDNIRAQQQVIDAAYQHDVAKLVFIGSSCVYPKGATQPINEEALMTGPLEPTSAAYATAKLAGIAMVNAYHQQYGFDALTLIPATLYGGAGHDAQQSHVLAALVDKFQRAYEDGASSVSVWGTGNPRREFLHVDDFVRAVDAVLRYHQPPRMMNVGVGEDVAIRDLAGIIKQAVGFEGDVIFDETHVDGVMQKLLDTTRIQRLGWSPTISLEQGISLMMTQEQS